MLLEDSDSLGHAWHVSAFRHGRSSSLDQRFCVTAIDFVLCKVPKNVKRLLTRYIMRKRVHMWQGNVIDSKNFSRLAQGNATATSPTDAHMRLPEEAGV